MKIGITGPTADRNLGDYAMYVNNVYDMGIENDYIVYSYDGSFTKQLELDYFSSFNLEFQLVQYNGKNTKNNTFYQIIKKILKKILKLNDGQKSYPTDLEMIKDCQNYTQVMNSVSQLDVLVVSGGGYINDLWFNWERRQDLFKIFIPIIAATKLNKKIVFTANGFGPFDTSLSFYEIIFSEIKKCEFIISSRDEKYSPLYLNKIGVKDYYSLPDDLYIVNEKLFNLPVNVVSEKYILIEMYGDMKVNIKNIKNIVDKYIQDGFLVKFVSFDVDPEASLSIKALGIPELEYVELDDGYLKLEKILSLIKNADLVICNRYHALVLSLTTSTPVINIIKPVYDYRYYLNKNSGVLDRAFNGIFYDELDFIFFDVDVFSGDLTNLNEVIKRQKALYDNPKYILNKSNLKKDRESFFNTHFKD